MSYKDRIIFALILLLTLISICSGIIGCLFSIRIAEPKSNPVDISVYDNQMINRSTAAWITKTYNTAVEITNGSTSKEYSKYNREILNKENKESYLDPRGIYLCTVVTGSDGGVNKILLQKKHQIVTLERKGKCIQYKNEKMKNHSGIPVATRGKSAGIPILPAPVRLIDRKKHQLMVKSILIASTEY